MTSRAPGSEPLRGAATQPDAGVGAGASVGATPEPATAPQAPQPADGPQTHEASAGPAARDDMGELEREIEQTREQLGQTVEALAAKVDVGQRARDKVAHFKGQARRSVRQARRAAVQRVSQGASAARQRRGPLVAGALATVTAALGYLAVRQWRKR